MKYGIRKPGIFLIATVLSLCLTGCGGAKVLKEPEPLAITQSLAVASDQRFSATLDWVIVRDGPGTWAKNVDWDEYMIRVQNLSGDSLHLTNITVTDSLGTRIEMGTSRKRLVKGTKKTKRRYKDEGLKVKAGAGAGTLLVVGAATAATAMSVGAAAVYGSAAMAGMAVTGLLLAPVLAVGGVFRGVNNSKVNDQIEIRQAQFPVALEYGDEKGLNIFFPLTPSPRQIELTYIDSQGEHILVVDTETALTGLHLAQAED
jgi:hypothetical protein